MASSHNNSSKVYKIVEREMFVFKTLKLNISTKYVVMLYILLYRAHCRTILHGVTAFTESKLWPL